MTLSHHYIAITPAGRFLDDLTIAVWSLVILACAAVLVVASWKEPKQP